MRYNQLIQDLQKLTKEKLTDRRMMFAFGLKSPSTIVYKRVNNVDVTDDEIVKIEQSFNVTLSDLSEEDCVKFPILGNVNAAMGYGVSVYDENQTGTYALSRKLANDLGIKANNADIIFGTGNSMEPTIKGGDALLVDKNRCEVCDGKIYCIRQDGQLKVKRLQRLSKTKIKIISDNKDYEAIILDFKQEPDLDFEIIGEIRWCGRIFL